jgi:hypothetical protein
MGVFWHALQIHGLKRDMLEDYDQKHWVGNSSRAGINLRVYVGCCKAECLHDIFRALDASV